MANKRHALLLGATDDYLKKVLECGMRVTLLTEPARLTLWQQTHADGVLSGDFSNIPQILLIAGDAHRETPFDLIVSFTEYGMEPAAIIAAALQLPGPALRCSLICRDKLRTRRALAGTPLDNVPYAAAESREILLELAGKAGWPLVLKPRFATGSERVQLITCPEEIPATDASWIAEGFAPGKEYSCETLSTGGRHHLLAVTEKQLGGSTGVVEVGHRIVPGNRADDALSRWVFAVLDAIEMTDGVGHIEVKRHGDAFYLIECHNRPGGDRIWQLTELATGIDMISAYTRLLAGQAVNVAQPATHCAAITYFQFPPGAVNVSWHPFDPPPAWVRWHHWPLAPGTEITPITDSFHRHGAFIAEAPDTDELERRINYILAHSGVS